MTTSSDTNIKREYHVDNIIYDPLTDEYIDAETGEVIEKEMLPRAYWKKIKGEKREPLIHTEKIHRLVHDYGLHTYIDDRKIKNKKMRRLKKWNDRLRVVGHEKEVKYIKELLNMAGKLELPYYVKDDAVTTLKKIMKKRNAPYYRPDYMAVILIASARKYNIPLTLKEVEEKLGIKITRLSSKLRRLRLKLKPINHREIIMRVFEREGKSDLIAQAMMIDGLTQEYDSKYPQTYAIGLLVLLSRFFNDDKPLKYYSQKYNVTEVSIRDTYKRIISKNSIEVYME